MSIREPEHCPKCGSADTQREEADIGVGMQHGPLHCNKCGHNEAADAETFFAERIGEEEVDDFAPVAPSNLFPGKRVDVGDDYILLKMGEYTKGSDGTWYAHAPMKRMIANLGNHVVTEFADGTITVSPSILVTGGGMRWHGFLEKGIWRTA